MANNSVLDMWVPHGAKAQCSMGKEFQEKLGHRGYELCVLCDASDLAISSLCHSHLSILIIFGLEAGAATRSSRLKITKHAHFRIIQNKKETQTLKRTPGCPWRSAVKHYLAWISQRPSESQKPIPRSICKHVCLTGLNQTNNKYNKLPQTTKTNFWESAWHAGQSSRPSHLDCPRYNAVLSQPFTALWMLMVFRIVLHLS